MENSSECLAPSTLVQSRFPSLNIVINVVLHPSSFNEMSNLFFSKPGTGDRYPSKKHSERNQKEETSKWDSTQTSYQQSEDESVTDQFSMSSCFDFLFSFIFHSQQDFENSVSKISLNEADMIFIKKFLTKRIVSTKLVSELSYRLDVKSQSKFIEQATSLRWRVCYQRNSNCLRAIFRRIIEFMKRNLQCPVSFHLPNHNYLKSDTYIKIVNDFGIAKEFSDTMLSPEFRELILSNSENGFRSNFSRWAKLLSTNDDADIRMGICPADFDRTIRDFQSKLALNSSQ